MGVTDLVVQPVELIVRLVEGVPLRHCVTVLVPVNDPLGVLEPVGQELKVGEALGQWEMEGDVVPVLDPDGLTLGLVVGVTDLHCVVVLLTLKLLEPDFVREGEPLDVMLVEGQVLGLAVGVTLLHCVVVLDPVKDPLAERDTDTVTDWV